MCQIVMVAVSHLLILSSVLFGFWLSHRYISRRFIRSSIHCPTQLALKGQYEAPPRGWNVLYLIIQLIIPRLMFFTAITGFYLILIHDFAIWPTISTWFSEPGWEWRLPAALGIGILINLSITVARLRSRQLRETSIKDREHSRASPLLTGSQA